MNKKFKVLHIMYIISIIALSAWGLPAYWIAIPSEVFIPVGCALCAVCIFFQIRLLWQKGKLFAITHMLGLIFIFMSFTFVNIKKSVDFNALRWFFGILMGLSVVILVLAIVALVLQYGRRHEKVGDGAKWE